MLVLIWIVLIILGLVKKESKGIVFFQVVFAIYLFSTAEGIADQWSYISTFQKLHSGTASIFDGNILFNLLLYVLGIFGNYTVALVGLASFCMLLIYKGVLFYTKNVAMVFSLYLIAPFTIDAAQIKNFMAMAIWIYFSKYLYLAIQDRKWSKNTILYLLGVVLSTGVHFSFIFTVAFVLLIFLDVKKLIIFIGAFIFLGFSTTVRGYVENLMDKFIQVDFLYFRLLAQKFLDYTANYNSGSSSARMLLTSLCLVFFLVSVVGLLLMCNKKHEKKALSEFVVKLNIASALLFPLMIYSMEMYRVQRNLLILDYILIAAYIDRPVLREKKLNVVSAYGIVITCIFAIFYLLVDSIVWNRLVVFDVLFKL